MGRRYRGYGRGMYGMGGYGMGGYGMGGYGMGYPGIYRVSMKDCHVHRNGLRYVRQEVELQLNHKLLRFHCLIYAIIKRESSFTGNIGVVINAALQ